MVPKMFEPLKFDELSLVKGFDLFIFIFLYIFIYFFIIISAQDCNHIDGVVVPDTETRTLEDGCTVCSCSAGLITCNPELCGKSLL